MEPFELNMIVPKDYFYCYSEALMHYLKSQGLSYEHKAQNHAGRTAWLFERCDALDKAITRWQEHNPNKKN